MTKASIICRNNGQPFLLGQRPPFRKGLTIHRTFSREEVHPYQTVEWSVRKLENYDFRKKKMLFARQVECPVTWDQTGCLITAEKYLFGSKPNTPQYEDSLRHPFDRIANTYTVWGWQEGYFATLKDAEIFNEELKALLVQQTWAPNSPVWFNLGHWEQWRWGRPDLRPTFTQRGNRAYTTSNDHCIAALEANMMEHPQASACFLTKVDDNMESIMDHYLTEGRIFSSGSGVGVNISSMRSSREPITGKGCSSGPMSFNRGWDTSAGGIKSGGKTRRAARMVLMFCNHPDIFTFVRAKNDQEEIAKIVLREHNTMAKIRHFMAKAKEDGTPAEKLATALLEEIPEVNDIVYDPHMDALLYGDTLSHQNANHSVSFLGDFWVCLRNDTEYKTTWVIDPTHVEESFHPDKLLQAMAQSVHDNAEPGLHMSDWINLWNPVKQDGDIRTSNPCSEYLFLDNTSCNLSSYNAIRFYNPITKKIEAEKLHSAAFYAMIAADLNIQRGGFPTPKIAAGTRTYRTTGIGFNNLGGTLMDLGLPYDSDDGRFLAASMVSLLTASCWEASTRLADALGSFAAYDRNKKALKGVLKLHQVCDEQLDRINVGPDLDAISKLEKQLPKAQGLTGRDAVIALHQNFPTHHISQRAEAIADDCRKLSAKLWENVVDCTRFRNAFVTVLAPTGTISAPLGVYTSGTTSAEPEYTLTKYKQLSGGGTLAMFNQLALQALGNLGYPREIQLEAGLEAAGVQGLLAVLETQHKTAEHLQTTPALRALYAGETPNPGYPNVPADPGPVRLAIDRLLKDQNNDAAGLLTRLLELNKDYKAAKTEDEVLAIKGKSHLEQVPWLNPEHLAVFDCSATNGDGRRSIRMEGHLFMLGALQPFLSGATSKTINLPDTASVEEMKRSFIFSHDLGIKCIALFRADSKANSVYQVDTPTAQRYNAERVWKSIVAKAQTILDKNKPPPPSGPVHGKRRKLAGRRNAQNLKFEIGGRHSGYVTVGVYPDGTLGEIFLRTGQTGSFVSGVIDAFCKSLSWNLQMGMPIDDIIDGLSHIHFDPSGFTTVGDDSEGNRNPDIKSCSSIIDLIAQIIDWLFPASNGRRLIPMSTLGEQTELGLVDPYPNAVPTTLQKVAGPNSDNGTLPMFAAQPQKTRTSGSNICPKCHEATYVRDGKCQMCQNPTCLYKDGGCG